MRGGVSARPLLHYSAPKPDKGMVMRRLVGTRARVAVFVFGAAALTAAGTATAAVMVQPASSTTEDVFEAPAGTTAPAVTTEAPAPTTTAEEPILTPAPATTRAAATTAPTVDAVTEPEQPTSTPESSATESTPPAPDDRPATFTDSAGNTYLPAPDVPVEPLPGEPNWAPPAG